MTLKIGQRFIVDGGYAPDSGGSQIEPPFVYVDAGG
jgi:hypothetical protein